ARIIGGCCGTTAEHLSAMRQALDTHVRRPAPSIKDIETRLGPVSALAHGQPAPSPRPRRRRA
ncbi:MAG TPA: homocysteine S-methyltransferase family protein, partial [Acidimicrobiia bacterium]|nr:homocysteine S-methyltransferase family protein [Acidimicrobiia bacterium]